LSRVKYHDGPKSLKRRALRHSDTFANISKHKIG